MRKIIALFALAIAFFNVASPALAAGKPVELAHSVRIMPHGYRPMRTVEETEMIGGHRVHFMGLSPAANAKLPAWADVASVDGSPYQVVAFDPNQGAGNFPGIVSLTAGSSNIVITNGTGANPTIDLATGISLSSGTAIQLTGASTDVISSSGLTVGFDLTMPSGTPTDVLVVNPTTAPTGKLARFQVGGTDKLTIDASGNLSTTGSLTGAGITNSGNASLTQSVSTNTNNSVFPPFTSFTDASQSITAGASTQVTLSSGTNATDGIVVGAVLKADTGTAAVQETITVTATTGGAGNQFTATYVNAHSGSITYVPTLLPVTVTPASMAGITPGQLLYVDSGASLDEVPVISTTSTQFVGLFSLTHATSPSSIAIVAGASVGCTPTSAGCSLYSAATGATGGWVYTAPNIQGADGNEQGIVTIVVPTNGHGANNVPYDLNFEGGQNGDLGKTSHTLTFNCLAANQDCTMFLDQGDTSGGANQKCFTFNTGGGGSTSTPSLAIIKCDGSLTSVTGNIQATSNGNGKGGVYTGDSGSQYGANSFVSGAFGNGALGIGGTGPIVAGTTCAVTMPNAGTTTALTNNVGCTITTGGTNSASAFVFQYVNAWNTAPVIQVTCGTVCAVGSIPVIPIITASSTSGFTVTWILATTGAATVVGSSKTFYVTFGFGK